jgi:type IV pilus assembly protein PilW
MNARAGRGFSLVEYMVGLVVAMVAILFAARTMISFETNRRGSIGGSDSIQSGAVAMLTIERDISQAGWDINEPLVSGCNASFSDSSGYTLASDGAATPLAPVVVNFNATPGDPDIVNIYSGSSAGGSGSYSLFQDAASGATSIVLNDSRGFGFNLGDVLVIALTSGNCAIVQAASVPVATTIGSSSVVTVNLSGKRFSPSAGLPAAYISNANQTKVVNLGPEAGLSFHTWSVNNGYLMMRATDLAGSANAAQPVVSNIVSIKALYGFDTRSTATFNPDGGMVIGQWSRAMIDADGDGVAGNRGDYQRIAAIRLAIVARSREPEKTPASGTCTTTTTQPQVFSSQEPSGIATIPITVNLGVSNDPISWQCYAYKVFETVVPLRNAGWKPGI